MIFEREAKIGFGSYGDVYQASMTKKTDDKEEKIKVAIKRNWGDEDELGISCLREMSFLTISKHPFVTELMTVSIGDPFPASCPMTPTRNIDHPREGMKEDKNHFIMEYADCDLKKFSENCDNFYMLKIVMCQILLALEYIHSKGIVHRDITPANILVKINEEDGLPYVKICDFGLSCHPSHYRATTPGAVTSWYRAPEICCAYNYYGPKVDVWSAGCVFFQIIKKDSLFTPEDDPRVIFKEIVKKVPQKFTVTELNSYINEGECDRFRHNYKNVKKESFLDKMIGVNKKQFNKSDGNIKEFCDLLHGMLNIYPSERLSASQALDHPFFNMFDDFKSDVKKYYPPQEVDEDRKIKIYNCLERSWAVNLAFKIYNNRHDYHKWYSDHIVFHAIRLFDQYLEHAFANPKIKKRDRVTKNNGKLHTQFEVSIYFYTCVYMLYKYFCTLPVEMVTWDNIFPVQLAITKNTRAIEKFEENLLHNVLECRMYDPTVLEYLDRDYTTRSNLEKNLDVHRYLINYGKIGMDYEGTMRDLYLQIKEGLAV